MKIPGKVREPAEVRVCRSPLLPMVCDPARTRACAAKATATATVLIVMLRQVRKLLSERFR